MFEINWSDEARDVYFATLDYWTLRNKSVFYSEKIIFEVEKIEVLIAENPLIGSEVNFNGVRKIKILKYFSLLYKFNGKYVEVISFWDNRRDPENLEIK